jgi:hypothetical protein
MKKPRKPKPRDKPKSGQQASRPPAPPKPPESPPKRKPSFLRTLEIAAAVAGLVAFGYLLFDLFYQTASPDIEIDPAEIASPFALPFSVKTQSIIFTMHKTSIICSFDMSATGNNKIRNNKLQDITHSGGDIERQNPGLYFCRNSIPASMVIDLTASISPTYCTNILWLYCWQRTAAPTFFRWVKTSTGVGYWAKGKQVN